MKPVDLIVDANSMYARNFWANNRDNADPDMVIRSCLLTVISLLDPARERIGERIDRMVFCWDGDHQRDKGNRKPKPAHYHEIREELQDLLKLIFGVAHALPPEHEADDAVGTIVYNNYESSRQLYVVSGDKDLMQLHGGNVHYYNLIDHVLVSEAQICRKFHVKRPSQIAIALAIQGDSVDNIKGIKGWGPKKVQTLFSNIPKDLDFQSSLELIADQIPPEHQDAFWESLDRTLLDNEISDMPDPATIQFASQSKVDNLDLPGVGDAYANMLHSYFQDDEEDDQEDV